MIAAIITPERSAFAIIFPFMKLSYSVVISLGIRDTMLIKSTMEIPFPTPFSLICSPTHIKKAEPAVNATTTTIILTKLLSGINPLLPNPIAMAIDSNRDNPMVT